MRNRLLHMILLLSLFFNIAHATIITIEEHCIQESVSEYIAEPDHNAQCSDLCDYHHLFHFTAILSAAIEVPDTSFPCEQPDTKELVWYPPFGETANKPPIA